MKYCWVSSAVEVIVAEPADSAYELCKKVNLQCREKFLASSPFNSPTVTLICFFFFEWTNLDSLDSS